LECLPHRLDQHLFDNVLLSAFKIIYEHEKITADELSNILSDLDQKSIFSCVNDLSDLGYVLIERDYSSGRKSVFYEITDEGKTIWGKICSCFTNTSQDINLDSVVSPKTQFIGIGDLNTILGDGLRSGLSLIHSDIENNAEIILRQITAQLIQPESGEQIWAEKYDREMRDIFLIQSEVAKKIASALEIQITNAERERIETYNKAMAIQKAIQLLQG